MKFYLEHADPKHKGTCKNLGNVIATSDSIDIAIMKCIKAIDRTQPNGEVIQSNTFNGYVHNFCTEITAEEAAIHHPNLFSFLGINI